MRSKRFAAALVCCATCAALSGCAASTVEGVFNGGLVFAEVPTLAFSDLTSTSEGAIEAHLAEKAEAEEAAKKAASSFGSSGGSSSGSSSSGGSSSGGSSSESFDPFDKPGYVYVPGFGYMEAGEAGEESEGPSFEDAMNSEQVGH